MSYLLLMGCIGCTTASGLCASFFNRKNAGYKNPTPVYNLIMAVCALICWAIMYFQNFTFQPGVLLYSLGFGLCYTGAIVGHINALKNGPLSLTTLFMQMSGIGTAIWGFFFWDAKPSFTVILGLVLIVAALILCLYQSGAGYRLSLKWVLLAAGASLSNVGCAVIQKTQQIDFDYQYGDMMMFFSMIIAVIVCTVIFLKARPEKPLEIFKRTAAFPMIAGILNMVVNLFTILLAASPLPTSLVYPTNSVGSLALTSIASLFLFKEKLSVRQWIGVAVGAAAIALLSI